MIEVISALVVSGIIVLVVAAALFGWGERVTRWERNGLLLFASGLMLASPDRLFGRPVGWPDLMMLLGLLLYLAARHGRHIWRRADALDGQQDGRLNLIRRD